VIFLPIVCSFFGHRSVYENIRPALYAEIERHITEKNVNTFYVGGYGGFDGMASDILDEIKKRYPKISVFRILAYVPGKKYIEDKYPTILPEGVELVPPRYAITHRNRWIVQESDYIIAYVQTSYGGAYDALKYARHKGKQTVNLAEQNKNDGE